MSNNSIPLFTDSPGSPDIQAVHKAMTTGDLTGYGSLNNLTGAQAVKREWLDATVRSLEINIKYLKLLRMMTKVPVESNVVQYAVLEELGSNRNAFTTEGGLPTENSSGYRQRQMVLKHMGTVGSVSFAAQKVDAVVTNLYQKEVENRTLWLLSELNKSLTHGNSNIIPQEFDSLYTQHARVGNAPGDLFPTLDAYNDSGLALDMRGKPLSENDLSTAAVTVLDNKGYVDSLFAPNSVLSGLSQNYFERQRFVVNPDISETNARLGIVPQTISTAAGELKLIGDIFTRRPPSKSFSITSTTNRNKAAGSATNIQAPPAPVSVSAALTASDPGSKFKSGGVHTDDLGTVFYAVSAINSEGESPLTILPDATTGISLAQGLSVDLKWTDGGGVLPATGYTVYRSKASTASNASTEGVEFFPIFDVSVGDVSIGYDGAAAGSVRDRNRELPDTEKCFMTEMSDEILALNELMKFQKFDLAVLGSSYRFMIYGILAPILYQPMKFIIFKNIGPYVK